MDVVVEREACNVIVAIARDADAQYVNMTATDINQSRRAR